MVNALLAQHEFRSLFVEQLGWDNHSTTSTLSDKLCTATATTIAHKRGFVVAVIEVDRVTLADRALLRRLHKQFCKTHHENICIYVSTNPMKQVWQWSVRLPDGNKREHREHPFFSDSPPEEFLERIKQLTFSLDEEDDVTIMDALNRVRMVLDEDAELNLFARKPYYARKSNELAVAMRAGDEDAFHEFVEFHLPLARNASKMLVRWFGMEANDAEQTAMIGLIEAAQRFKPELGFQFSTYASFRLKQACQRYGLNWSLPIRIPVHAFWPCYSLRFDYTELIATVGRREAKRRLPELLEAADISPEQWRGFIASYETLALTDISREDHLHVLRRGEVATNPFQRAQSLETQKLILEAIEELPKREAKILRRRYGIGCPEQTLDEVGVEEGVSKERIRQLQARGQERLQGLLLQYNFFPTDLTRPADAEEENELQKQETE